MRAIWPVLLLAGCYSPAVNPGAPCDPTLNNCPAGQECLPSGMGFTCGGGGSTDAASELDANDPIDGPADLDGDGLLNAADNCPTTANADQADDESDGVGDVCDPCPVNANNVDGDGDGVGDVCDPNPNVAGDSIILFESFRAGVRPAGWFSDGPGTWTYIGGEARVQLGGAQVGALRTNLPVTPKTTAITSVIIDDTNGPDYSAGLANPFTSAYHGSYCTLYRGTGDGNGGGSIVSLYNLTADAVIDDANLTWDRNVPYVLIAHRDGTDNDCLVANASGTLLASPSGPNTSSHAGSQTVALRGQGVTARFAFLLIVQSP